MRLALALALMILAAPTVAQTPPPAMDCVGTNPDWSLITTANGAIFDLVHTSDLTLQLTTIAEGADWPRAYTFVGRGDSAIVILEAQRQDAQQTGQHPARILTQRGETPLLLTGHCDLG